MFVYIKEEGSLNLTVVNTNHIAYIDTDRCEISMSNGRAINVKHSDIIKLLEYIKNNIEMCDIEAAICELSKNK